MKRKYVPDLTRQMAICQGNYARLLKLLPQHEAMCREFDLCHNAQQVRVTLQVDEVFRYTSTVIMRQSQPGGSRWLEAPELVIRLYHDAGMAEVICARRRRQLSGVYGYPNPDMHQPDEKHQLNLYLSEWLNQCLRYGKEQEQVLFS
ncbi:DUF1249 domain-containing protein [Nitrincola sp.]|uniref:DUF1249 domain-containing protein n=1 Tax=Nitrincola sp. TaxID=1926584 RepID=UPI003A93FAB4